MIPADPTRSEAALWTAAAAALAFLPAWGATAVLGGLLILLWRRVALPRRERRTALAALAAAALLSGWAGLSTLAEKRAEERLRADTTARFGAFREALERTAVEGARVLGRPPRNEDETARAIERLTEVAARSGVEGATIYLLDGDGQAAAWGGAGLLHALDPASLPRQGRSFRQSFDSATLLAVAPLADGDRVWKVVAGASRERRGPPPLYPPPGPELETEWHLGGPSAASDATATTTGAPALILDSLAAKSSGGPPPDSRLAMACLAIGLIELAVLRGFGLALLAGTVVPRRHSSATIAVQGGVGLALLGIAAGAGAGAVAALLFGGLAAAGGWRFGSTREVPFALRWLAGAIGFALVACAAGLPGASWTPGSFGADLFGDAGTVLFRWSVWGAAFGALALATASGRRHGDTHSLIAIAAFVAAALALDRPWVAAIAMLAGVGALAAAPAAPRDALRPRAARLVSLALLAALAAAVAWESGHRARLAGRLPELTRRMEPPSNEQIAEIASRLRERFSRLDAGAAFAPDAAISDWNDLAYVLWKDSPLARADALSALVVEREDGARSVFSFGLPLDAAGRVDPSPVRWADLAPAPWRELRVEGVGELVVRGQVGARLRYALVPRPGFDLGAAEIGALAPGLLRGGPAAEPAAPGFPPEYAFVVYRSDGGVEWSPWREGTPRLVRELGSGTVATPDGEARFARDAGAVAVLLPMLDALSAIEVVGAHATGALLSLLALATTAALLALPRASARDFLRRTTRSYSKRLVLLVTVLVLVPLVALYVVLARTISHRFDDEKRADAETALTSAQRVLGEYVLSLEPGFGVGTALDDALLVWLSRVVGHEVTLYWGSEVYAASERELFTAGLLPRRIPGDVWERLALRGDGLATRKARLGGVEYLELYVPLRVPGAPPEASRFFLSMPLLAQQEEAIVEAARLQREALVATFAVVLALAIAATRLARNFTQPITELVAGTRRIAAGAEELAFRPAELELTALAEAIDQMARRVAEGRRQLLSEKQLVERIVDNVTAGVVCCDRGGYVLLANRFARELLSVEPGTRLVEGLAARAELAEVATFVHEGGTARLRTVRLAGDREWTLVWAPVEGAGEPAALLVVEDVSEVVRAQRLEAWAAMARLIAHEIKNPLTPIRLSTEHLREAWSRDPDHFAGIFERCTANILAQVDELREIASQFATYSHIPRLDRQPGDIARAVAEVVAAYAAAPPPGVSFAFRARPAVIDAPFDARLLPRAVRNLLENAVRAVGESGRIEVDVESADGAVRIRVADDGPGAPADIVSRLFEPYFSTHASGTGLGLPIARRIAEEHGGSIAAANRPSGGFEVTITIPST